MFSVFATLSLFQDSRDDAIDDVESLLSAQLHIFIKKQLSSKHEHFKIIGVIATLRLVARLGGESASDMAVKESVELLALLLDQCKSFPSCLALTFDELNAFFKNGDVHEDVDAWISDHILERFTAAFVQGDSEENEAASSTTV